MKITERQKMILTKLDQVIYRKKTSGMPGYFLGIDECTTTINSLVVKGFIDRSDDRKKLRWTNVVPRA